MANFDRSYPDGRLSDDDEGALQFGIAADKEEGVILINFFKPIVWFGLDVNSGIQLIRGIAEKINEISDLQVTITVSIPDNNDG